jgi:hypothetical protein
LFTGSTHHLRISSGKSAVPQQNGCFLSKT